MVDFNRAAQRGSWRGSSARDARPSHSTSAIPQAVRDGHEAIAGALGAVDILVNNAGILSNNKAEATDTAEWRRVLGANLDGAFYLAQCVVPAMKARRFGRIINTCSLAAKTGGLTAGTAYSVSKGALTSLTFSLARELAPHGVTANGISPAYVKTPMITEQLNEEQRQKLLKDIPVGASANPRSSRMSCASSLRRWPASSPARSSISTADC